ncbi:hypothetical protein CIL05_06880 [Virgibacillus profundi]|uniref:Uncharacterized protein n=1 Tax=Virgibacillus profundi TaxID=2024555 RepID=A0A2A2IFU8_9BACI|nr:hypothetical protein [Virgibacillus profundi]PAV30186.1 hypothetical protein CIL05_06880 [Virgibacillus profundi]PXY54358.1 hypothetical protein CIT14_06965 [Virgibacillus profundi]
MSNIFKFQEEEQCDCETCHTIESHLEIALKSDSKDEVRHILRGLYEDAHQEGYRAALVDDIEFKTQVLTQTPSEDEFLN